MFAQVSSALLSGIVAALVFSNIYLWFVLAGDSGKVRDAAPGALVVSLLCAVIAFVIGMVIARNVTRSRSS
jgi:hypothetical protein